MNRLIALIALWLICHVANAQVVSEQAPSTTSEYKATIITSNFTIPMARFDFLKDHPDSKGTFSAFNSLGAGVSLNWGSITSTTNNSSEIIDTKFRNTFGLHLGVLFSTTNAEEQRNVFSLTGGISVLNFQLGTGYEFGTITTGQSRHFVTIAYNIPIHALAKGSFWIWKKEERGADNPNKGFSNQ
ncbi:hypothetical protein [Sphingobacterium sp.]|uniref:hypothetical protein n=1 Tax=Sphingobacterium sp. TaxID=341027 RepID=UPI0028B20185|nr:hypothetical protein [Sphingobacterium sp.]